MRRRGGVDNKIPLGRMKQVKALTDRFTDSNVQKFKKKS